jgi:hypothetical protein
MNNDLVYLDRRAMEERVAARKSVHAGAREIHLELAQAYEFRVFLMKQMESTKSAPLQFETTPNHPARKARRVHTVTPARSRDHLVEQLNVVAPHLAT